MAWRSSKYSKSQSEKIHWTIFGALNELATFNGVDMNTMKTTPPYSFNLANVSTQKMAAELKKMIDMGVVVKSTGKSGTRKYMLRSKYNELMKGGKLDPEEFGYGDYRDAQQRAAEQAAQEITDELTEEEEEEICRRLSLSSGPKYTPDW